MITRRQGLILTAAALAAPPALARPNGWVEEMTNFIGTGGLVKEPFEFAIPEVVENGNRTDLALFAPGAAEVLVLATLNPDPRVFHMKIGAKMIPRFKTRIRLAETQDVIAMAKLPGGDVIKAQQTPTVVLGGCGGPVTEG